jgi:hypothetical protein
MITHHLFIDLTLLNRYCMLLPVKDASGEQLVWVSLDSDASFALQEGGGVCMQTAGSPSLW